MYASAVWWISPRKSRGSSLKPLRANKNHTRRYASGQQRPWIGVGPRRRTWTVIPFCKICLRWSKLIVPYRVVYPFSLRTWCLRLGVVGLRIGCCCSRPSRPNARKSTTRQLLLATSALLSASPATARARRLQRRDSTAATSERTDVWAILAHANATTASPFRPHVPGVGWTEHFRGRAEHASATSSFRSHISGIGRAEYFPIAMNRCVAMVCIRGCTETAPPRPQASSRPCSTASRRRCWSR
jgi:hypothetical protein